jgi:hypothetical protein
MAAMPPNDLEKFLMEPNYSHARESILMNRLIYDFKLVAGLRGYCLESYTSDVDHEGFDIILDDQDQIKKLQVKTVMRNASTSSWEIHKRILRPQMYFMDKLGFELSPTGEGVQGGIVLMEINPSDTDLEVKYFYTDIIIIVAFYLEIIYRTHKASRNAIERVYDDLHTGLSNDLVILPKSCFLSTSNPEQLLALTGFHNNISTCSWIQNLLTYSAFKFLNGNYPMDTPEDKMKTSIADEIKKCTDDNVEFT